MTLDILRKTGGWCVELQQPLKGHGSEWKAIEIRPTTADHLIRWSQGRIPSTLALLSELCDVPETLLRQLPVSEFDRCMLALQNLVPALIKADWEAGTRPLATPDAELPDIEMIPQPDPVDPRYPKVDGPVVRMPPAVKAEPPPENDAAGMDLEIPPTIQPVH